MTQPPDTPPLSQSTDIDLDPDEVVAADVDPPASSDPDELTDDAALGGTGGPNAGGAG